MWRWRGRPKPPPLPEQGWATTDTGELRALLSQRVLEWSAHAVVRAAERDLDHAMISAALSGGLEVIEDYPGIFGGQFSRADDAPGWPPPACGARAFRKPTARCPRVPAGRTTRGVV